MRSSPMAKVAAALSILALVAIEQVGADEPKPDTSGRLEFRILADKTHDKDALDKAKAADSLKHPPEGYRWVRLGEAVTGSDPKLDTDSVTDSAAHWKANAFAGFSVQLTGRNLAGSKLSMKLEVVKNTADTLSLRPDPSLFFRSVSSYRIESGPSEVGPDDRRSVIREVHTGPGWFTQWILVKLDRLHITEKDLARVYSTTDARLKPAVAFELTGDGGERMGALTRAHLPENGGTFRYRMGIILDDRLLSAPVILDEIHGAGIINLGDHARPEEADRIVQALRAPKR